LRHLHGLKTPVLLYRKDKEPFLFAGLWETWRSRDSDERRRSCTIITQPPNEFAERIHSRLPVVLDVDGANAWIEPGKREPEALLEMLIPSPASAGTANHVSRRVES